MLTATYDGQTIRLYKNAKLIGQNQLGLDDDEASVHVAPIDPWDNKRKLDGDVRDLTIWNAALPTTALEALWNSANKD